MSIEPLLASDLLKPSKSPRALGVSRSWVYEAAKDGPVPLLLLGGADGPLRFVAADLEAWLQPARAGWTPSESLTQSAAPASPEAIRTEPTPAAGSLASS